ncbi:TRAP transporter small permease [Rhizobiaceae bacterium BDR2-2]|uniref:TRAP transporter small permease protein n=1 Tax=Ectorhizobium quercum TaxID=2965071 RepID=A0AAE3SXC2_9HYPH|nr:TRAP transporter small permease [Ectorhizobium quercum]MCX8998335.1 TRAP transporter small permease [Ectorhizobium quercum]
MRTLINLFFRFLEILLVVMMAGMALMVFVNVVMRYGMNSGIAISEEMSRYFFIWVTFIGAVLAYREHLHLGVETLVAKFGRTGRLVLMALSNLIVLGCSGIFFWGTWVQLPINTSMVATVSGLSMGWVYGIGLFTGGGIFLIALERLVRQATGRITDEEIAAFAGENMSLEQLAERT